MTMNDFFVFCGTKENGRDVICDTGSDIVTGGVCEDVQTNLDKRTDAVKIRTARAPLELARVATYSFNVCFFLTGLDFWHAVHNGALLVVHSCCYVVPGIHPTL
jgi:hypothetical protein